MVIINYILSIWTKILLKVCKTGVRVSSPPLINIYIMNTFSASDLVKQSAFQIWYLRRKRLRLAPTTSQKKGLEYQREVSTQNHGLEEMKGIYIKDDVQISFCNDFINKTGVYEVKYVDLSRALPDWYFTVSLLQTAFYKSLLMLSDGKLVTPAFKIKEGCEKVICMIDPNSNYFLLFGNKKYQIEVFNPYAIVNHFLEKARTTLEKEPYSAQSHDAMYKHKDYEYLKQWFTYKKI